MDTEAGKIESIRRGRKLWHKYYMDKSAVYRKFAELEEAAFKDGELSKREKEFIAIGISLVIGCESCLEWHIGQALSAGATEGQVIEALGVGMEMGVGPTTVTARFAGAVLEEALRGGAR